MNKKMLNIVLQKDINGALFYALPLCIILSDKKNLNWFYTNYMEICGLITDKKKVYLRYADGFRYGRTTVNDGIITCNEIPLSFLKKLDITDVIEENINLDTYLIINVDEFYLPSSRFYANTHFAHPFLVYGYDKDKKILEMVQFDDRMAFNKLQAPYLDFQKAFEGAETLNNTSKSEPPFNRYCPVILIENNKFSADYPYDINVFIYKLKEYLNSSLDMGKRYIHRFESIDYRNREIFKSGIDTYDIIATHLSLLGVEKGVGFDYRQVHMLYENKSSLHKRLIHAAKHIASPNVNLTELIAMYGDIVKIMNIVRLKYLKAERGKIASPRQSLSIISELAETVKKLKKQEYDLVYKICENMEKH